MTAKLIKSWYEVRHNKQIVGTIVKKDKEWRYFSEACGMCFCVPTKKDAIQCLCQSVKEAKENVK